MLLTDLVNLVRKVQGWQVDARSKICRNCFHVCSNNETLQKHEKLGSEFSTCQDSNSLAFKKFPAKTALPLVVCFDLQSIIVLVSSFEQNPPISEFRILNKHIPSGYCCEVISHGSPNLESFHLYRGEDCMQVFVKLLESKRYLREPAKTNVIHRSRWTSKRACDIVLDMWNYYFCGQRKSLVTVPFLKSFSWLRSLKVPPTAQNTELRSHSCTNFEEMTCIML